MKNIFRDQLQSVDATKTEKSNVRWLCYSAAFADFCAALSCPVTNKWTWSCPEVTPQLLSISEVVWGVAIILICKMWYKGSPVRNFVWRNREFLNIGYWTTTTGCVIWMFISPNPYLLYIVNAMIFWFVFSSWFGRIIDFTKAKLFNRPELRNSYDTMAEMYSNIASTSGYVIGAFVSNGIPLKLAFIFWQIGVTTRVIGRGYVFLKNRRTLSATDDETENANDQEETEIETLRMENDRLRRELEEAKGTEK